MNDGKFKLPAKPTDGDFTPPVNAAALADMSTIESLRQPTQPEDVSKTTRSATVNNSKFKLPSKPSDGDFAKVQPDGQGAHTESGSSGFVQTSGSHFIVDGTVRNFRGSNDYFLVMRWGVKRSCSRSSGVVKSVSTI
jgi:hypothetical protein